MLHNPVFGNELRKSLFRRKPMLCFGLWGSGILAGVWLASSTPATTDAIFYRFPDIALPLIAPAFAAGAFAKEREQQTWTQLMLTRLTTRELLFGKFFAAYLPVLAILTTMMAPVMVAFILNKQAEFDRYPAYGYAFRGDMAARIRFGYVVMAAIGAGSAVLQGAFYVTLAMVCSHYCRKARVALGVCYTSLIVYAILAMVVIDATDVHPGQYHVVNFSASPWAVGLAVQMHLLVCAILTLGFWVLLAVGLRFEPEA